MSFILNNVIVNCVFPHTLVKDSQIQFRWSRLSMWSCG